MDVLESILGRNAEVTHFSSGSTQLPTTAWGKIKWLAGQLNTNVVEEESAFEGNTAGEGGIDIVAWMKMGDGLTNRILFFAQCACSPDDWSNKVHESSDGRWRGILQLGRPHVNLMFIPQSYRDIANGWDKGFKLGDAVLFDRKRILEYFGGNNDFLANGVIGETITSLATSSAA